VVPGTFETRALSNPNTLLNNEDFPVLGGPKNKTLFLVSFLVDTNEESIKPLNEDLTLNNLSPTNPSEIKS
jgi:hypothetical protein